MAPWLKKGIANGSLLFIIPLLVDVFGGLGQRVRMPRRQGKVLQGPQTKWNSFIYVQALKSRFLTDNEIKNWKKIEISSKTVIRKLKEIGLSARHSAIDQIGCGDGGQMTHPVYITSHSAGGLNYGPQAN